MNIVKQPYGRTVAVNPAVPRLLLVVLSYGLVALVALAPRVLNLGGFVTVDEISFWMQRSETFLRALQSGNYAATAISTHPGVTTMWLGSIGVVLRRALFAWGVLHDDAFPTVLTFFRLPVVLVHTAGVVLGYALLRRMLPALMALLAALLWATDPFVIAYSRVLHVDALAGTFMTLSLLAACVYWLHQPYLRFLLIAALSGGLALLSKSPAFALLPLTGLIALMAAGQTETPEAARAPVWLRSFAGLLRWPQLWPLLLWSALCLVTVVFVWPALWAGPREAIEQLRVGVVGEGAEPHMQGNFFLGREDDAPGLLFYPVALVLRLTPWALLGLILLPCAWRRAQDWGAARRSLALLACFAIIFLLAMSLFPKKFNRYIEPIFPALDVLAAVGLVGVLDLSRPAWAQFKAKAAWLGVAVLGLASIANVAYWHPYEITAFNQVLGGARAGAYAFQVGWGEGLEQVAGWLNAQPDITGVRVASTQPWALQPYLRDGAQAVPAGQDWPKQTGYVVVYVRSAQTPIWSPFDQFFGQVAPAYVVNIHGIDYAWIYRMPPQIGQARPADFGPAIHLRGLALDRDVQRGQPLALRLFWSVHAQPAKDMMLFAHLIGPDAARYGQIDLPLATSQWHPGEYMISELPLLVPADAPRGTYRLAIGLYDPENGQRLALTADAVLDPMLDGPDALLVLDFHLP